MKNQYKDTLNGNTLPNPVGQWPLLVSKWHNLVGQTKSAMLPTERLKEKAGRQAAKLISPGMTFGLGTGSTVKWLIEELQDRFPKNANLTVVPTSEQSARLARQAGWQIKELNEVERLELTIDGADEADPSGNLIKGGGGALLREKLVAAASDKLVIIADPTKLVEKLGKFPLPVEVIPFGYRQVQRKIKEQFGVAGMQLRSKGEEPFVTDSGNFILDVEFGVIDDPAALDKALQIIPGVVETGLFVGMVHSLIHTRPDGGITEKGF